MTDNDTNEIDMIPPAAVRKAAALLYDALHQENPAVEPHIQEVNPLRFGAVLKAISGR